MSALAVQDVLNEASAASLAIEAGWAKEVASDPHGNPFVVWRRMRLGQHRCDVDYTLWRAFAIQDPYRALQFLDAEWVAAGQAI